MLTVISAHFREYWVELGGPRIQGVREGYQRLFGTQQQELVTRLRMTSPGRFFTLLPSER